MKVFISTSSFARIDNRPLELLSQAGADYRLNPYGRRLEPAETVELIQDADALIAGTERLDRDVLSSAHALRVISRCGTGLDNVDLEAARELGIEVFNTPDAHVDGVAELALAGILDVLRSVTAADRRVRSGAWDKPMGSLLRGKTVGIIGLGRVGRRLVALLRPFESRTIAFDSLRDETFAEAGDVEYCLLDQVFAEADILTLHTSYAPDLHHVVNRDRLALMRSNAVLVNTARGGLVDEAALYDALREGRLAGAYLDTFEREPYSGPLTELVNVVLTPHIGSYAAESRLAMECDAVENLLDFFREPAST